MNVHDLKRILIEGMKTDMGLNVPKSERTRENKRKFRKEWRKAFKGGYAGIVGRGQVQGKPPREMPEKAKRRVLEHRLEAIVAGHLAAHYTNMQCTGLQLAAGDERLLKTLAFRNRKELGRRNKHTGLQYRSKLVWWHPESLTPAATAERRKSDQTFRKTMAAAEKRKLAYAKWLAENRKSKPKRRGPAPWAVTRDDKWAVSRVTRGTKKRP